MLGHQRPHVLRVCGHHYALVHVDGLERGTEYTYEVRLDGERVWPDPARSSRRAASAPSAAADPLRIAFGSCRVAAPHDPPWTLTKDEDDRGREIDALRLLALRMAERPRHEWPDLLLLLGDQVYADEVSPAAACVLRVAPGHRRAARGAACSTTRSTRRLYRESWGEPVIRWLLSTVPSAMIFDDHDVHDDWNISQPPGSRRCARPTGGRSGSWRR